MNKKLAILIDGGWFSKVLGEALRIPNGWPNADQVYSHVLSLIKAEEEIQKIMYYDSEPYGGTEKNPITGQSIDYSKSPGYSARKSFFHKLGEKEFVALRRGEMKQRGWVLNHGFHKNLINGKQPLPITEKDIHLDLEQKGVDMRIGIDVATLSIKKQVDRILLISGDQDMIPAMKLARREGIQVFLCQVGPTSLNHAMIEDSDGLRVLKIGT